MFFHIYEWLHGLSGSRLGTSQKPLLRLLTRQPQFFALGPLFGAMGAYTMRTTAYSADSPVLRRTESGRVQSLSRLFVPKSLSSHTNLSCGR